MEHPIASAGSLADKTAIAPATANRALDRLEQLAIVKEITAQIRNRLFRYARFIEIIGRVTELPSG
jgi:DNA-binding transcriptional regulator YhcF (GntR family)